MESCQKLDSSYERAHVLTVNRECTSSSSQPVLREVCPSHDQFMSGHQILSVIRGAMQGNFPPRSRVFGSVLTPSAAHESAVVRCQIVHRDVSSGNILICPVLSPDKGNRFEVKRVGVLADWEFAKSIELRGEEQACQTTRTVSYSLLSAYFLITNILLGDIPVHVCRIPDQSTSCCDRH